jgi:hypothetical protein
LIKPSRYGDIKLGLYYKNKTFVTIPFKSIKNPRIADIINKVDPDTPYFGTLDKHNEGKNIQNPNTPPAPVEFTPFNISNAD